MRSFVREAASRADLLADLRLEKFLVVDVAELAERRGAASTGLLAWLRPMTGFDVEIGLRQVSSLLKSGITLLTALETVADEALSPWAERTWSRIAARIVSGHGLSEALAAEPRHFNELVIRLAEVGERSGELERAVARAADQLQARRNLRAQVINALVYPFLTVTMAVGVSAFLVVAVIPKISDFLKSGGVRLPALTQMLMDVSEALSAHGLQILIGLAATLVVWFVVRLNETGREAEDVILLRVPVTGRILRLSSSALFARAMQIMTASGVTLLDALATASRIIANRRCRRRIAAAHAAVMRGSSLGDALRPASELTPMLRRMAAVGETTGAMPEIFAEAADFHEMLLALAVKRFGMLIEPVMIVITGTIVGFVYIAFFLAIFAIAGTN